MIALHVDDARLDPRALLLTGRAILLWPPAATQPSAVVIAPRRAFTTRLREAHPDLRPVVLNGSYEAVWLHGRVLVTDS